MSLFLRILEDTDKPAALRLLIGAIGGGIIERRVFAADSESFSLVPSAPLAYWASDRLRSLFTRNVPFHGESRSVCSTNPLNDDFRYARLYWEPLESSVTSGRYMPWAKGGAFSPGYYDIDTLIAWSSERQTYSGFLGTVNRPLERPACVQQFFRPGLTWPRRTQSGLGMRAMPAGCIFADKGPAAFVEGDVPANLLALLAISTSSPFRYLVELQMAFGSYEVGVLQRTPVPPLGGTECDRLGSLAREAWARKRTLDTVNETSHAFILPRTLRDRIGDFDPAAIKAELSKRQEEIDERAFDLYRITGDDRSQIEAWSRRSGPASHDKDATALEDSDADEDSAVDADDSLDLVSWSAGVTFGRFDFRLATGERPAPREPEPFDPLPARSPGMLPEGDPPFRQGTGILVDDPGHRDDLTDAIMSVLNAVKVDPPADLRHTLACDFFPFHIQRYSKSRRKAPIYWQLATPSASYSVWLYLDAFSDDTLYKVQNDYVGPKLRHEEQKLDGLRREYGDSPTASQRKELDSQETFAAELRTFLDEVKRVAPLWKPDLDDGVIINFAPLWRLVPQHRPWQKECKTTWDALADGDYDWSHLAMHLWPERVVPKCAKDRSLAIAHGLEDVFWSEGTDRRWKPRPSPTRPVKDLIKERTSPAVKAALASLVAAPQSGGAPSPMRNRDSRSRK